MKAEKLFMKIIIVLSVVFLSAAETYGFFGGKFRELVPENGRVEIPADRISDGKAHYFEVTAADGIMVKFFVVKSRDGVLRAAVDACDVCYKSGKGYVQKGDFMVCTNCGRRFATDRINEVKGGCNPAPLKRQLENDRLVITMKEINRNAWYCEYK